MITVFGAPPTRGLRVLWMLEEMGLEYELRRVDFRNRHADEEFMRASPSGAAPGLVDGEVRMMESMAIVEYLGARYGPTPLVLSANHPDFPAYIQFLHYGEGSLSAPLNVVIASRFFAPEEEKQNWGAKMAVQMVLGRCSAVAAQLERTPYVAGELFTAADISCAYAFGLLRRIGAADRLDPAIVDYMARVEARPAFQRAMRHEAPLV